MPTCENCGKEITAPADLCPTCAVLVSARPRYQHYLLGALALAAVIALALFTHLLFQPHFVRPPAHFLPASTIIAVGTDLRPDRPARRRLRETWSQSDLDHLRHRTMDVAQELVYWTGLQLDLEEDASSWFGGEIVAGALGGVDSEPGGRPTFLLVARVTNSRRARANLDAAVRPLAREAGWDRSVIRHRNHSTVVWTRQSGNSALACAVYEGCLLIAHNDSVIESCIAAAADPAKRFFSTDEFATTRRSLPSDALIWCCGVVPETQHHVCDALLHLREGWGAVLRYYLGRAPGPSPSRDAPPHPLRPTAGIFTLALTTKSDGVRLLGRYSSSQTRESPLPEEWHALAQLLPREALTYAFVHQPERWIDTLQPLLPLFAPREGVLWSADTTRSLLPLLTSSLGLKRTPRYVLLALLPRNDDQRPALIIALPNQELANPSFGPTPFALPAVKEQIGDAVVLATDQNAIAQCRLAADDPGARLNLDIKSGIQLQAWASPARLAPSLASFEEVEIEVREDAGAGEILLLIEASPQALLCED